MTSQTLAPNALHKRIMRTLTPVVVAVFVVSSLALVIFVESRWRTTLDEQRIALLNEIDGQLDTQVNLAVSEISAIARSTFVRDYEDKVSRLTTFGDTTSALLLAQNGMVRSFSDIINRDRSRYLGIRYLTTNGYVWGEATNIQGQFNVNFDLHPRTDLVNAQVYNQALTMSVGDTALIGPIVRLAATNEPYVPIYLPVDTGSDVQATAFIQVDLRLTPLFELMADPNDPTLANSPGRRLLLFNSSNSLLMRRGDQQDSLDWLLPIVSSSLVNGATIDNSGQIVTAREVISAVGESFPMRLVIIDDFMLALAPAHFYAIAGVILQAALGFVVIMLISGRLKNSLKPLADARVYAARMVVGQMDTVAPASLTRGDEDNDELSDLVASVNVIADKVRDLNQQLDRQARRRTRDIEIAARIGRETATMSRIDDLLNHAIDLICDELGFYHAQVFFVDDIKSNAVLVYSHGEAGQKLLAKKHKIAIGSSTLIGTVTGRVVPVIVNDTLQPGQLFAFNALLPATRAELGLPLVIGNDVIGALDIQSREPDVFSNEDLPTFRLLADQIAIAVNKARLVSQSEWRIHQIDTLNRQLTRMAWEEVPDEERGMELAYRYNLMEVEAVPPNGHHPTEDASHDDDDSDAPERRTSRRSGNGKVKKGEAESLKVPITILGEVVGSLDAMPIDGQVFTDGDHVVMRAVADRVALALENARLFQETQTSLAETSMLYQLSRYLNEATTLDDILQALIVSVMTDADGGQVWIFDDSEGIQPEWMEISADLAMADRDADAGGGAGAESLVGTRLKMSDHPYLRRLHNNQVSLINDTRMDSRLDPGLQILFRRMQARAIVFIPLNVRGAWLGLITVEYGEARNFTEREGRIFNALIDQAGIAIDNRLLLERTEAAVALNENLYAASRLINTAQGARDLVYAAAATTNDINLDFGLAVLSGELDANHWPKQCRIAARSRMGQVEELSFVSRLHLSPDSPILQREPETILDHSAPHGKTPSHISWLDEMDEPYPFVIIFPLFSANTPIALFFVMSHVTRTLSIEDFDVYRALTGQMSTQIENSRLLQRTESALDETRRLYQAARAISMAQDSQAVYAQATEHLARPLMENAVRIPQTFGIAVMIGKPDMHWDAPLLACVHSTTNDPSNPFPLFPGLEIDATEAPLGRLALEREEPFYIPNVEVADSELDNPTASETGARALLRSLNATSALIVPIQSRQRWFGSIICQSTQEDAFNEQYVRFVESSAGQIALAVENRILFEEARTEAERAQLEAQRAFALAEAAQLANQVGVDFEQNLSEVLRRVAEAGGYDRWQLAMISQETGKLMTSVIRTFDNERDTASPAADIDELHPLALSIELRRVLMLNDVVRFPAYVDFSDDQKRDLRQVYGKSMVSPILQGRHAIGALLIGRDGQTEDLDDGDERLVAALAAQIALALENRRLFRQAEAEQQTLQSILATLPSGVVVLDPETLRPTIFNDQAENYLGEALVEREAFNARNYELYRTGTQIHYPDEELPVFTAITSGELAFTDDVAVIRGDEQIDLLVNAAPIVDDDGNVTAIIATFSDISNLRSLENTLQENLRETVAVYEAQRQLSEARELPEVLDVLIVQLAMLQPTDAYILMADNETGELTVDRHLVQPLDGVDLMTGIFDGNRPLYVRDVDQYHLDPDTQDALHALGVGSLFSVPLRSASRDLPIGWLLVTHEDVNGFNQETERVLTQLGDIAATTIENRTLFQSTALALRETATLYAATNAISRSRDFNSLVNALDNALRAMGAEFSGGFLAHEMVELGELFSTTGFDTGVLRAALSRHEVSDEGLFIEDLTDLLDPTPLERDLQIASGKLRGIAITAMPIKDGIGGRLMIGYTTPHHFTESDRRYLITVSDSAAVVLNNIVLVQEIQQTLDETTVLYEANRALTEATETEEILNIVVKSLAQPHIDQVFIALLNGGRWDAPGANVHMAASWAKDGLFDLHDMYLRNDELPTWALLETPSVMLIDDVHKDKRLSETQRIGAEAMDMQSIAIIPLRVPSRVIGAIWIASRQPHRHNERELRIYQSFAEQASLSIEATYLLEQTEYRAHQLQTSAQVGTTIGKILDLEELMPLLVSLIRDAFGYDYVQIFLMDDADDWAELRASTGEAGRQLLLRKHKLQKGSHSVIGTVTATGQPFIVLDTAAPGVAHKPNPLLPHTRSEMALPLIVKDKVIGALDVQSNRPNTYTDDDVRALTTLAAQISIAIDNANLYQESQTQANRMSLLFEITTAAAAANGLAEALQTVAESLNISQGALTTTIYLQANVADRRNKGVTFKVLRPIALAGSNQPLTEIEIIRMDDPAPLLAILGREQQPMIVDDLSSQDGYFPVSLNARSAVIVPMSSNLDLLGMIVMEAARTSAYSYDEIQLLLTLAGSLSAIVQSAQLLEQLTRANEDLLELDRLKSDFLANMSHELRTPLNSIIGFSKVMLKGIDGPLTEMQEQDLTTIYNSGQHLLTLINDVLDQAKIAAGKMDMKFAYFEMKAVIEAVRSIGIGLIKDKNINLHVEIANNLPKAYGDEFRTRQVLINLVSNATKFTQQGTIMIRLYPITYNDMVWLRADVVDSGIGIAQSDIPLLFEAFQQVDSSLTRTAGGTGLGLPIAKSLIEMQGGRMEVTSEVNVGSTFSITVPTQQVVKEEPDEDEDLDDGEIKLEDDSRPTLETRSVPRTELPPRIMQAKRQILLIEDSPDMVDQFRRALQREGFDVMAATIPLEAEAMVSGLRPTLVVMDVNFAKGAGWNLLERLKDRDDTFDIPIIVVSLSDEVERAYKIGAHTFIQRPFVPDDLIQAALSAEKESNMERILIIDDQPDTIRLLTQLLDEHGNYRVFSASNGEEGISLVARRRPDLVILDLRMPGMDGFAVLNELRSNPETSSIPVMVVTGDIDLNAAEQQQLVNVRVLPKTDISQDDYDGFLVRVQNHLNGND